MKLQIGKEIQKITNGLFQWDKKKPISIAMQKKLP